MNYRNRIAASLLLGLPLACASQSGGTGDSAPPSDAPASAPSSAAMSSDMAAESMAAASPNTIVDVAVAAGEFGTLVTALQAAELVTTLQGEGPFTVFAPTDAAFAKLPEGTLDSLLQDKEKLTQILTYHVVPGKVMAADVAGLDSATTVSGEVVEIDTSDGVKVGDANVVQADVGASNGVIHVIDTVLIPTTE